jgi:hypothetical protein
MVINATHCLITLYAYFVNNSILEINPWLGEDGLNVKRYREHPMKNSPHWIESLINSAISMPTENLAIVGMVLVALTVIWKNS